MFVIQRHFSCFQLAWLGSKEQHSTLHRTRRYGTITVIVTAQQSRETGLLALSISSMISTAVFIPAMFTCIEIGTMLLLLCCCCCWCWWCCCWCRWCRCDFKAATCYVFKSVIRSTGRPRTTYCSHHYNTQHYFVVIVYAEGYTLLYCTTNVFFWEILLLNITGDHSK